MKILLISDCHMRQINGVVTSTMALQKGLIELGHDVRILCPSYTSGFKFKDKVFGIPSVRTKFLHHDVRVPIPGIAKRVLSKFRLWKPDIIHTQTEFYMMQIAIWTSKKYDIPLVHTYHTMWGDSQYLRKYTRGLIKEELAAKQICRRVEKADIIITPTQKTKDALIDYGVTKSIEIIPTGIEFPDFTQAEREKIKTELRNKFNILKDDKVLIYIGRVSAEKNVEEIIDFTNRIRRTDPKIRLVIVGGIFNNSYKELINNHSSHINFLGTVSPKEVKKYYLLGDIFVTASITETQGLTYIEAMSSKIPVLCRYDDCINDLIVNGETGFMYHDYYEFQKYCLELLDNQDLREKIAESAYESLDKYSIPTFAKSVEKIYLGQFNEKNFIF